MPDLLEVDVFDDGGWIFAFDGRVFEIFGKFVASTDIHQHTNDSWRVHLNQLHFDITGPDKKGLYSMTFNTPAANELKTFKLDEAALGRIMPLVDAVMASKAG
jgi:hypothetical protein